MLLLNISAMFSLIAFTAAPFWDSVFSAASFASAHAVFAVAMAETALRTDSMNVTASGAVKV